MTANVTAIARRSVLLGALATTVAGCAESTARASGTGGASSTGSSGGASTSPSATPSPTNSVPTRDEIIAKFAGRTPHQWSNGESFNGPLDGLVRRTSSDKVVLTLDACGGPYGSKFDKRIIDLLKQHKIPALLFLNSRWIKANRAAFDDFASHPELFEIGNHGTRHMPLSCTGRKAYKEQGTANVGEVYDEVMGNHLNLTELLGRAPKFFRCGTAWYDEVALQIVKALGETAIGFDINGDAGTTFSTRLVNSETRKATPGSIIICHMNQPKRHTYDGLALALPHMLESGITFSKLDGLTLTT